MKTFAFASLSAALILGVAAQTSSSTTEIPSGISSGCQTFLSTLNTDSELASCTGPLLSSVKYYASNSSDSTAQLDTTLSELCTSSSSGTGGCDANLIRQRLTSFWQSCSTDLQAKNSELQAIYDSLYMITPLVDSICSKDSSGGYCLQTIAKAAASSVRTTRKRSLEYQLEDRDFEDAANELDERSREEKAEAIAQLLKRQSSSESLSGLENETNVTSTADTNAAFLFISSASPKSILCSDCSKLILASYIKFETSIPYGIGLRTSSILAPQSDIYKAAESECGHDFVYQVNVVANTTSFATVGAANSLRAGGITAIAAAAAVVGALVF
ncbi:hypothetical protein BCV70DRAFT_226491 [Testicularia cyperi]|uniref:DUF7729 domain-containing protein n=1 Tax=Testicularia cyperi TaxID=1882483 RepID=A0A317XRB1_9BASI|nr:hypothetical protein BCV70DRAFT_226491 [Testicularia cyperi]